MIKRIKIYWNYTSTDVKIEDLAMLIGLLIYLGFPIFAVITALTNS
jgi:hypothetical protein